MNTKTILITGGAGFIGSHLVNAMVKRYPDYHFVNLDKLTYAGNLENLKDIETSENYTFVKGDIVDLPFLQELFSQWAFNGVIHLAAESHVDRSIADPMAFMYTNVIGTANLLLCALERWKKDSFDTFYHVSTDEVYGSLGETGLFKETTPYDPRSPYSASKASSDHVVRAYYHTYDLPIVISNCSNNYGPLQFPEKLIPLVINNIRHGKELPVYGDGSNVRDWLWVGDHVDAMDLIYHKGKHGETYNIGGNNEMKNLELVELLCDTMDEELGNDVGESRKLITFVKDRLGHDKRYAIDSEKIKRELGWEPSVAPEEGLKKTVQWYLANQNWLDNVTSGAYRTYYQSMYQESA